MKKSLSSIPDKNLGLGITRVLSNNGIHPVEQFSYLVFSENWHGSFEDLLKCEDSWRVDLTSVIASKVLKKCVQLWQNSEMLFQNIYVECSTKTPINRFHFFFLLLSLLIYFYSSQIVENFRLFPGRSITILGSLMYFKTKCKEWKTQKLSNKN